jgi:hypothetical protein
VIVYRTSEEEIETAARLRDIARQWDDAIAGASNWRDAIRAAFIDLAVLESGVHDQLCPDEDWIPEPLSQLHRSLTAMAGCVVHAWHGRRYGAELARVGARLSSLSELPLPERAIVRVPEGFAYYALYPEMYADAADEYWRATRAARVVVIGLRTIGVALAAAVHAALITHGAAVLSIGVRPRDNPLSGSSAWRSRFVARSRVPLPPGLGSSSWMKVRA